MHPSSHRLWHPYPTNPWSSITSPESSPWWLTPSWTTMLTGEFYSFLHTHQLHGGFTYAGSKWCRVHAAHHGHWLCHLQKVVTWMPQRLRTVDINHSWISDFYWKIESCLCAFFITRFPQWWASWIRPMHHVIPFLQSCQLGHWDSSTNKHFWEVCAWDSYQTVQSSASLMTGRNGQQLSGHFEKRRLFFLVWLELI